MYIIKKQIQIFVMNYDFYFISWSEKWYISFVATLLMYTSAVLCPWARHFTPRKYWLITQEAMAPSRHDWKIVDWDVKPQHNQLLM